MRIVCLSDVHSDFQRFSASKAPSGDLLLVSGDITNLGNRRWQDVEQANMWLAEMSIKFPFVAYVYGNHDLGLVSDSLFTNEHTLNVQDKVVRHQSGVLVQGANLTTCYNYPGMKKTWTNMTDNKAVERAYYKGLKPCDLLVCHSPPEGPLGQCLDGDQCGSVYLRNYINKYQPRLVVCGHIHEAAGEQTIGNSLVVNSAQRFTVVDL